jgi:glutathione synthase/RimK-type ligase-like ATP-grasp enzyme
MLLILTSERDFAADFLIVELIRRGLPYFRLNAEDIAGADFTFSLGVGKMESEIAIAPRKLALDQVRAIWYRRAIHPNPLGSALSAHERQFVAGEMRHLATALVLNTDALWVNPIDRVTTAEHKLYQLEVARSVGFKVPRTLVSRDAKSLRDFANGNRSGTICKPIFHGLFFDGSARFSAYTRRIQPEDLEEETVTLCPVLLQEEIPRAADIRATMIGRDWFVAEIKGNGDIVDWRSPKSDVSYAVSNVSEDVRQKCCALLDRLGLVYGAFDFIRTPDGELVFLEVNPTGEWAWLEDRLGFPMRDAFIQLFYGAGK